MAGDPVVGRCRGDRLCGQSRRTGDDAVQDDGGAQGRGTEQEARDGRVLQAADGSERRHRRTGTRRVPLQGARDDSDLVLQHHIADPGTASGHGCHRQTGEHCDESRGGGGVGDPHVTGHQQPVALGHEAVGAEPASGRCAPGFTDWWRRRYGLLRGVGSRSLGLTRPRTECPRLFVDALDVPEVRVRPLDPSLPVEDLDLALRIGSPTVSGRDSSPALSKPGGVRVMT